MAYMRAYQRGPRPAAEPADKFDEIQPPCMTPLVYAAGSREHRSYLLIDYVNAQPSWLFNTPCEVRRVGGCGVHRDCIALHRR